jgi:hypothetical protein
MRRRKMSCRSELAVIAGVAALVSFGCNKQVKFRPLPLAGGATAQVKVQLTYDRNNTLEVTIENAPQPSAIKPEYTRYVLWAATPDRQRTVNAGQLRVDDNKAAKITTLTPLRNFVLFITAEVAGDVGAPGPDVVFEAPPTEW